MFYVQNLLQRRGGKFGVIWIAATNPKLLSRRDCAEVSIAATCSDILDHILQRMTGDSARRRRFSLYLSSKLMYGVAYVHKKQSCYLLHDIRILLDGVLVAKPIIKKDDTVLPEKVPDVTLADPVEHILDPEFGRMLYETFSPPAPPYEFFSVPTPRSSESEPYSPEDKARALPEKETVTELVTTEVSPFTVPPSIVTLPEQVPFPSLEEDLLAVPGISDLPPFRLEDFVEEPVTREQVSEIEPAEPSTSREAEVHVPMETEGTPVIPTTVPEPRRPEKIIPPPPVEEETPVPVLISLEEEKRKQRAKHRRIEEEGDFVLEPVVVAKRRRRQRLVYDEETIISDEEFRSNLVTSKRLTRPLAMPSLLSGVSSLFRRPGSRIGSSVLKSHWERLRTFPEPTDPSPPGSYAAVEVTTLAKESAEISEPSALPAMRAEDITDEGEMELFRERSAQSESSIIPTPSTSFRDISQSFRRPEKETPGRISSLEPPPTAEIIPTITEVEEPLPEVEEEIIPLPKVTKKKECIVSPLRTPPPPSPKEPLSPSNQKVLTMFTQSLEESPGEPVTFHTLISPLTRSRQYAATALSRLLELHQSQLVTIKQTEPYAAIRIYPGPRY